MSTGPSLAEGASSFDRAFFDRPALEVAPELLGAVLRTADVAIRLTEVEAYLGEADPGSHAFRGRTRRNAAMFGEPGRLYAYFTYGMHTCGNAVCGPVGEPSAVLFRAGEVVDGIETARARRSTSRSDADLARGPARLMVALGLTLADDGADLLGPVITLGPEVRDPAVHGPGALGPASRGSAVQRVISGPRTGVSGPGGTAAFPWRFCVAGDPTVSPYRPHMPRRRDTDHR